MKGKVNEIPTHLKRRYEQRIRLAKECSRIETVTAALTILGILMVITELMWFGIAGLLIVYFMAPTIMRLKIMKEAFMKYTGIRTINMKLQALTDYLKVKFIHVPEHYECEEIK